ncbi:glycosyltransferase family 4 protein [Patescibacteria group bacterium]|nr:glycosyltransferase family 4 protein [Patescibacteria group bacterium]
MIIGLDLRCLQDNWRTGVGEYAWQTIKHLAEPNFKLNLIGYANAAGSIKLPEDLPANLKLIRQRIPNRLKNLSFYLGLENIESALTINKQAPDVLWLPNPMFVNWSASQPAVLTVHDLSFIHYKKFFPGRGRLWYFPMVKKLLRQLPKTTKIAAVSNYTADDLLEQYPNLTGQVEVVYPGVEEKYFPQIAIDKLTPVLAKYNLSRPYFLTLGTIEPRKNHLLLLNLYSRLVQKNPAYPYDLVIAGAWGWRTKKISALLKKLKLGDRVKVLGYLPAEDKPFLYQGAKLFLYPSFYEGFGMPVLEAMASGLPVLASQTSSLPEVVGESGLLLNPYDLKPWLKAVEQLISDDSLASQFSQAGRIRAKDFTWSKTAASYVALFVNSQ